MSAKEQLRLVKKAVKGDPDAYGALIAEHQEYLYKMAYLYVRNEAAALDAVGSAMLDAYQSIRTLKQPEYFKTWLTRILIRAASNEQKKMVYYSELDNVGISERYRGVSLEEKCDLSTAIEQLSEKYRTVIYLKYFSEFTVKEIAYALDVPEGSVKAYLSRAREELKRILKEDYLYEN
ncbi:MAG: sigma-70 family RNA polymerase sigma factor [Dorea sp.]|jgi:RNA polymerase sigma-70 factor (ECF subfamily)|nr:sigma-70 family RNA polymerase sigma factor [Dorea sp.]